MRAALVVVIKTEEIPMMTKTILAATCAITFAGGCIRQDGPPEEIARAIPTNDQVKINLPDSAAKSLTDVATYYKATRDVTRTFNGSTAWVLITIHAIVQYPVTSQKGDVYTWGPWSDTLDPAEYKLDVTANADGTFDYQLSGRSKTMANSQFEVVIDGHAAPGAAEGQGTGNFLLDFDAGRRVNPIDSGDAKGQVDVHYDLAARHLDLHIMTTDANGNAVSADYAYEETADHAGDMTFEIQADAGGGAALEDLTLRSRWLGTGAGRSDVRFSGGDLGTSQATASECWGTNFIRVYYTDSVNYAPTEGDVAKCAFATSDLP
jgi:hypothetical protein